MYLVIGATGNIGGPVARQLHQQGHEVRALVRDPARAAGLPEGIERALGDLDDPQSVAKAVQDVEAIFLMQVGGGTEQTETVIDAARHTRAPRIVLLSSVGARLMPLESNPIGAALAARERILRESGLGVTYLRPNTFASNAFWWLDGIRAGKVVDATGEGRHGVIDPEDIARVAVVTLTEAGHEGKGYFLTGPEALTSREQVEIIAEVTGRPIEFEDLTPQEFTKVTVRNGTPPEQAYLRERLNDLLRAGRAGFVTDDVQNLTGFAPGTFRAWCERNVDALR
ncbi:NAD(P)H-binding protein [Actinomadura bangladeshensis]|uniref:NAD-dependent epimerase/dehydratase family protein n=1 Tax=Actinomadura bangladeshensis TaxID=453573 RepID=A0A4R4NUI1_9ACTN|nr:NAD(P)H-binding protein [Actinomadura bangladeshensis]TDC13411.1 NAD-dependent epimerase/dehydratase family protein [Actinomadura bangladeshensis]